MKKNLKLVIFGLMITFCSVLFTNNQVKAALTVQNYNGASVGGSTGSGGGGDCNQSYKFCRWQLISGAPSHGIRVSFVYYDGSSYQQLGKYMDIWPARMWVGDNLFYPQYDKGTKGQPGGLYQYGNYQYVINGDLLKNITSSGFSSSLKSYFLSQEVMEDYAKELTGHSLTDTSYFGKPNEAADPTNAKPATKGYRFFIEPIRGFKDINNGKFYIYTLTEFARQSSWTKINLWYLRPEEELLYTTFDDIGIRVTGMCPSAPGSCSVSALSNPKLGHALQIIDFSDFLPKTVCNYETGEGYPEKGKQLSELPGGKLTDDQKKCCDEKKAEIVKKYGNIAGNTGSNTNLGNQSVNCRSTTVAQYVQCMFNSLVGSTNTPNSSPTTIDPLELEKQQVLKQFQQDYPACVNCDYAALVTLDENYKKCLSGQNVLGGMLTMLKGDIDTCQALRKQEFQKYENQNPLCPVCRVKDGVYYGKLGMSVSASVWKQECDVVSQKCEIVNGVYYGKTGIPVDQQTYELECSSKACKYVDGKYYGKKGTQVTRIVYLQECDSISCKKYAGKYYGKNGDIVSKAQYEKECSLKCDEDNEKHFPKSRDDPDKKCCEELKATQRAVYSREAIEKNLTGSAYFNYINEGLKSWFNEPGKEYRLNCLDPEEEEKKPEEKCYIDMDPMPKECCNELKWKYPDKPKRFWINAGCDCEESEYEVKNLDPLVNGNCSLATTITSKDTENWDCIFESDNLTSKVPAAEVFKDYYVKFSNPYCAVYCRDEITYEFPSANSMTVKAGNHFTVGNTNILPEWSPVQFISKRTCRTSGPINSPDIETIVPFEKWKHDYGAAQSRVIKAWDEWKVAQQKVYAVRNKHSDGECGCCGEGCKTPCGTYYTPETVYYTYFGQDSSTDVTPGGWCSLNGSPLQDYIDDANEKEQAYIQAVHEQDTIEDDIWACSSWDYFDKYRWVSLDHNSMYATRYSKYDSYDKFLKYEEFSPDLTIDYKEPTNSSYNYKDLLKKTSEDGSIVSNDNYSTYGYYITNKQNCPSGSAPNLSTCVNNNTSFHFSGQSETHATFTKKVTYQLQDNVFNLVKKPQGTATSKRNGPYSQLYLDLGYSALHTHFMTPTGNYPIDLTFPSLTPKENSNSFNHNFDQFNEGTGQYVCTYTVHNEIIENKDPDCVGDNCEPIPDPDCDDELCAPIACGKEACEPGTLKGLNLIFRPISLANPFPGVNGTNRTPGSNWNDSNDISQYITNNRGVKADKLYSDRYPMYQITLTPSLIKEIRNYNKTTTYNDFNMNCDSSTGRECKSQFIRGGLKESQYDFSKYFQDCKLSGNSSSQACCGIGNWNECSTKDGR